MAETLSTTGFETDNAFPEKRCSVEPEEWCLLVWNSGKEERGPTLMRPLSSPHCFIPLPGDMHQVHAPG